MGSQSDQCRLHRSGNPRWANPPSYLPYAVFTEVIWGERAAGAGNKGKVQEVFFFSFLSLGGVSVSLYCGHVFARTPFFPCAFTHSDTDCAETGSGAKKKKKRTKEKAKSSGGRPRAGWGSSLCCWSGCHITPCGDDCAIYCLAGAGDLRRRNQTGSTWRTELTVVFVNNKLNRDEYALEIIMWNFLRKLSEGMNWADMLKLNMQS